MGLFSMESNCIPFLNNVMASFPSCQLHEWNNEMNTFAFCQQREALSVKRFWYVSIVLAINLLLSTFAKISGGSGIYVSWWGAEVFTIPTPLSPYRPRASAWVWFKAIRGSGRSFVEWWVASWRLSRQLVRHRDQKRCFPGQKKNQGNEWGGHWQLSNEIKGRDQCVSGLLDSLTDTRQKCQLVTMWGV